MHMLMWLCAYVYGGSVLEEAKEASVIKFLFMPVCVCVCVFTSGV